MGFACDNVLEYEIVLGNGTILEATATHHSDLWQALKGVKRINRTQEKRLS